MVLVKSKEIIQKAVQSGYAIGAFNAENMEMVEAIIEAAEESNSPIIVQTTSGTLNITPPERFCAMVKSVADKVKVPVVMHLDHGDSFERVAQCLRAGYTSIMIDASKKDFYENVKITNDVIRMAKAVGVPVEAELGIVGGKEDGNVAEKEAFTDPYEAENFVKQTGVDFLAIGIGNVHGVYKADPKLRFDILQAVKEKTGDVPLVLHGTSGIPDEDVSRAVSMGIAKVNYATELRQVFTKAIKAYIDEDPGVIDPKKYNGKAKQAVKELVKKKLVILGSTGKA
ncbi:class II fructose-bisphosphate aldolase [Lactovum miscens]|uniref:Fructose-bisphosphate aldolase class II/tagatose 1,6-diphosphate aldolase GatY/KbaY n=1 Tax=Lactovum miscens TaxID=190387 RepID=A0A841C6B6_9LACT|nr:class II fructose-bisphosphate aldolase [Lactovum miscens]MBB5887288.1 fructose-bisphosphate aldolase class II/tagatose 1,6-diphosphate aldolase GatY/KbaY [Lactovum miscens]